jgi:hypothetical protein
MRWVWQLGKMIQLQNVWIVIAIHGVYMISEADFKWVQTEPILVGVSMGIFLDQINVHIILLARNIDWIRCNLFQQLFIH